MRIDDDNDDDDNKWDNLNTENSSRFNLEARNIMENYWGVKAQSLYGKTFTPSWAGVWQSRASKCTGHVI